MSARQWRHIASWGEARIRGASLHDLPLNKLLVGWAQEIDVPEERDGHSNRYVAWVGGDQVEQRTIRQVSH